MTRKTPRRRHKPSPSVPTNTSPSHKPLVTLDAPLTQDEIAWLKAAAKRGQRAEDAAQKIQENSTNG